jgi:RNA polymerase sigma factor (sigma-70 family)
LDGSDRQGLSSALRGVADGDPAALEIVYQKTSAKLFGICLRILKERSEAEDVLQEVYLTVWRRAGAFDPGRGVSPITWLAALARNRAIDRLRTSKAHLIRPIEAVAEAADPAPLASDELLAAEDGARLVQCLDLLEPRHAAYIRAAYFDGLTYVELAERAGAPLGTMKSWIRRSLLRLRACIEHE